MTPGEVEAIAQRVAEILRPELEHLAPHTREPRGLVDAQKLARLLGVSRDFVYRHADELGAIRLAGARGRLRFDPGTARAGMAQQDRRTEPPPARARRPRRTRTDVELLPIKGQR